MSGGTRNPPGGHPVASLEAGLRRVVTAERLLVASDFDGTLAPIADHPDAVMPDPAAVDALRELAALPGTWVTVVSGRSSTVLRQHLGDAGLGLVGSHGAEWEDVDLAGIESDGSGKSERDPDLVRGVLDKTEASLDALAAEYDGALVERKPTAVAFHYRRIDPSRQDEAARRATRLADGSGILRVQHGHKVVELVSGTTNKGDAIDRLRRAIGATATVFVGDDRTDEHAFARLGPGDLAVRIGPGDTCAPVRIASQADVAPLFRRLRTLRTAATTPARQ